MGKKEKRFLIALSFPGDHRSSIAFIADKLGKKFGREKILYDFFHKEEFAIPKLNPLLPSLYKNQSVLIVVFFSAGYKKKKWCGLEWAAIKELIETGKDSSIMLYRFDKCRTIPDFGCLDVNQFRLEEIVGQIIKRLKILQGETKLNPNFTIPPNSSASISLSLLAPDFINLLSKLNDSSELKNWEFCYHLPDKLPNGQTIEPLDFTWCGKSSENRWNVLGEPTLYLAQATDVAMAEFARNIQASRPPGFNKTFQKRKVYRFKINLSHTLDFRNLKVFDEICKALSLSNTSGCFVDKTVTRAVATYIRNNTVVQAIFVPSIAFLDNPDKWSLVVFLEKLGPNPKAAFKKPRQDGFFYISD